MGPERKCGFVARCGGLALRPRGRVLHCLCIAAVTTLLMTITAMCGAKNEAAESMFLRASATAAARALEANTTYSSTQRLRGAVFGPATPLLNVSDELEHRVTWSTVTTFSPAIENHAQLMFRDRFNECEFHAMGPAMSVLNGRVVANVRLWMSQYLLSALWLRKRPVDSWQENYVYSLDLDINYRPKSPGRLLAIPTTTNAYASYRKDGPVDPRSFVLNNRLYVTYYAYGLEPALKETAARMYLWDYEDSVKVKLYVSGIQLQKASDINWMPLVVGGDTLYFVYSFDPLRVLRCDPSSGACVLVYAQSPPGQHEFAKEWDHLRGGTPFVEYRHPYYVSVAHSTAISTEGWTVYHTHLVVVSVDPWRVVYVSEPVRANDTWSQSAPVVTGSYIGGSFWYPTALIFRDSDTADVGCHLNDYSSHVIRLAGLSELMNDVMRADAARNTQQRPAKARVAQQYVLETIKRSLFRDGRWLWFTGDYRKY